MELLPDDEESTSSIIDEEKIVGGAKTKRLGVLVALFLVCGLVATVILDLLVAGKMGETALHKATVDLSHARPEASLSFDFSYESHFSDVTLESLHCQLPEPGGAISGSFTLVEEDSHTYDLALSCSDEDVSGHVELLWLALTQYSSSDLSTSDLGTSEMIRFDDLSCDVGLQVNVFRSIGIDFVKRFRKSDFDPLAPNNEPSTPDDDEEPSSSGAPVDEEMMTHETVVNSDDKGTNGPNRLVTDFESPRIDEGDILINRLDTDFESPRIDEENTTYHEGTSDDEETLVSEVLDQVVTDFAFPTIPFRHPSFSDPVSHDSGQCSKKGTEFRQLNTKTVELAHRLEMPDSLKQALPSLTIVIPEMHVTGQATPTNGVGSNINTVQMHSTGMNATFNSLQSGSECEWFVVQVTCPSSDECPWYAALVDWYSLTGTRPIGVVPIHIDVNGNGSFIETFLGSHHNLALQQTAADEVMEGQPLLHHRELQPVDEPFDETFNEMAASCLGLTSTDAENNFDSQWCWLFDWKEGAQVVAKTSFMESAVKLAVESEWEVDRDAELFTWSAVALAEIGANKELLDWSSNVTANWNDRTSTVDLAVALANVGTWHPMTGLLNASVDWDDGFALNIAQGELTIDTEERLDATGNLILKFDNNLLVHGFLNDASQDVACTWNFATGSEPQTLAGVSVCKQNQRELWNLSISSQIDTVFTMGKSDDDWYNYYYYDDDDNFYHDDDSYDYRNEVLISVEVRESTSALVASAAFKSEILDGELVVDVSGIIGFDDNTIVDASGTIELRPDSMVLITFQDRGHLDSSFRAGSTWQSYDMYDHVDPSIYLSVMGNTQLSASGSLAISSNDLALTVDVPKFGQYESINILTSVRYWMTADLARNEYLMVAFDELNFFWNDYQEQIGTTGSISINLDRREVDASFVDSLNSEAVYLLTNFSWESDNFYDDTFDLVLNKLVLEWNEETQCDFSGDFTIDFSSMGSNSLSSSAEVSNPTVVVLSLLDTEALDLDIKMSLEMGVEDNYGAYHILMPSLLVLFRDDTLLDATGSLDWEYYSSIAIRVQDATHFGLSLLQTWDLEGPEVVVQLKTLEFYLKAGEKVDIDIDADALFSFSGSEQRQRVSFDAESRAQFPWMVGFGLLSTADNRSSQTMVALDDMLFRIDEEVYLDSTIEMEFKSDDEWTMTMEAKSDDAAALQMGMLVDLTVGNDDRVRVLVEDMNIGWKNTSYVSSYLVADPVTTTPSRSPAPTVAPSVSNDVPAMPSNLPTVRPTQLGRLEELTFSDIEMTLAGGTALDAQGIADFEGTLEAYYESIHATVVVRRRYLADENRNVGAFTTDVVVTDQSVDSNGNTIMYDQTIVFTASDGGTPMSRQDAQTLLLESPLSTEDQLETVLDRLKKANEGDFGGVTSVAAPEVAKMNTPKELETSGSESVRCSIVTSLVGAGFYYFTSMLLV